MTMTAPIAAPSRKTRVGRYVNNLSNPQRREESLILLSLFERVTGLEPHMWGTTKVGFGRYHYEIDGRQSEFMLMGFDPADRMITIYLDPEYEDRMGEENTLGRHERGNSCLIVRNLKDINLTVLETLLTDGLKSMRKIYKTEKS